MWEVGSGLTGAVGLWEDPRAVMSFPPGGAGLCGGLASGLGLPTESPVFVVPGWVHLNGPLSRWLGKPPGGPCCHVPHEKDQESIACPEAPAT